MPKSIFLNWREDTGDIENYDLLKAPDLKNYNTIFFDPLSFAINHKLRENSRDISSSEYIKLDKDAFMRLMASFKRVSTQIRSFLDNEGILVIRSNIPNTYIQIRSLAAQGTQKFTESVLSAFFWLEEFIGKYSFLYRLCTTMEFVDYNNAMYRNLNGSPIAAYQSQDIIPEGQVTVLARCGAHGSFPLITKVSLKPNNGEIFFIPEFRIANEAAQLNSCFEELTYDLKSGLFKPGWVTRYEREMSLNNPYKEEIEAIDQKIDLFTKRKLTLVKRANNIMGCTGLLYKAGEELINTVRSAFEALGFETSDKAKWLDDSKVAFGITLKEKIVALVQVTDTELREIPETYFETLTKIEGLEKLEKPPKMILVANTDRQNQPETRSEYFAKSIIESAPKHEYCLLPSTELYDAVSYSWFKSNSEMYDVIRSNLRKDIMGCVGEFKIDERKYLIRKTASKTTAIPVK